MCLAIVQSLMTMEYGTRFGWAPELQYYSASSWAPAPQPRVRPAHPVPLLCAAALFGLLVLLSIAPMGDQMMFGRAPTTVSRGPLPPAYGAVASRWSRAQAPFATRRTARVAQPDTARMPSGGHAEPPANALAVAGIRHAEASTVLGALLFAGVLALRAVVQQRGPHAMAAVSAYAQAGPGADAEVPQKKSKSKPLILMGLSALHVLTIGWMAMCWAGVLWFSQSGIGHGQGIVPGMSLLSRVSITAGLIPVLAAVNVLHSAANRDRLDGTTFKVINVALTVATVGCGIAEYLNAAAFTPLGLRPAFIALSALVSALIYRKHGVPKFKFDITNPLSAAYAAASGLMALTGLGLWIEATVWNANFFIVNFLVGSHTIFTSGTFCLFAAFVLNTLQSAAVAGPKRLSSVTYKQLNLSLVGAGGWMLLGMAWSAYIGLQALPVLLPYALIGSSLVAVGYTGYRTGAAYKP